MQIQGFSLKLDEAALPWRPTRHPGVSWIALHLAEKDGAAGKEKPGGDATVLIRMEPGCGYPAHRHLDVEEVLILRGGYRDDRGEHAAGAYLRYEPGSVHAPVALGDRDRPIGPGNEACLLFAVARGGVESVSSSPS
jgi:anti-sigma factor ChrR (cupin superfamily)